MERRELLSMIAATTGVAFVGGNSAMAWEAPPAATSVEKSGVNSQQYRNIVAVCETLIPRNDSPGAIDAGVPPFFVGMVKDCYTTQQQDLVFDGLSDINQRSLAKWQSHYHKLDSDKQYQLLNMIDKEAVAFNRGEVGEWKGNGFDGLPHYFSLIKQLVIFCFFTSKTGGTQVLRHSPVPGKYEDIAYTKGEASWAAIFPW